MQECTFHLHQKAGTFGVEFSGFEFIREEYYDDLALSQVLAWCVGGKDPEVYYILHDQFLFKRTRLFIHEGSL